MFVITEVLSMREVQDLGKLLPEPWILGKFLLELCTYNEIAAISTKMYKYQKTTHLPAISQCHWRRISFPDDQKHQRCKRLRDVFALVYNCVNTFYWYEINNYMSNKDYRKASFIYLHEHTCQETFQHQPDIWLWCLMETVHGIHRSEVW
jgi:hypothetical protein